MFRKEILTYDSYNIEIFYFLGIKIWRRFVVTKLERPKEYEEKLRKLLIEEFK